MGSDKLNLNYKRRKKLKELKELYHPDTKVIFCFKPKCHDSWTVFHSDISHRPFKTGAQYAKAVKEAEYPWITME